MDRFILRQRAAGGHLPQALADQLEAPAEAGGLAATKDGAACGGSPLVAGGGGGGYGLPRFVQVLLATLYCSTVSSLGLRVRRAPLLP